MQLPLVSKLNQQKQMLQLTIPKAPFYPDLQVQLESIWKHQPQLLSFHFGIIPPVQVIEKARKHGILVGVTATCKIKSKRNRIQFQKR